MYLPIEEADIPTVVTLLNRAYRGSGPSAGWSTEETFLAGDRTTEALLRADLVAKPGASLLKWVDEPGGGLVGCVWLEPLTGGHWYLGSLAAEPSRQNGGLGRRMLAAAEDWVRDRKGCRIRMTVINVRKTLIAWYKRRGYVETDETEPFPYGDNRFGTPLRSDLAFVVLQKDLS